MSNNAKTFVFIFVSLLMLTGLIIIFETSHKPEPNTAPVNTQDQGAHQNNDNGSFDQYQSNDPPSSSRAESSADYNYTNLGPRNSSRNSTKAPNSVIDVESGSEESAVKSWYPVGRFLGEVFDDNDITTQTVNFGSITNYSGNSEQLYLTISMPKTTVDPELQRPLIVAMPGGNTIGFCDSTLNTEQSAMLRLAKLGYVGITLTPLLDSDFCDGADNQAYYQNMIINNETIDKAFDYLNLNAEDLNIDIHRAALFGYSIGGQTALMKVREDFDDNPFLRTIIAFSSVVLQGSESNSALSPLALAGPNAPDIFMLSFEPDVGFGPGVTPDARGDCETLVGLGYNCTFQGIPVPGHSIHLNTIVPCSFLASLNINCHELGVPIVDDNVSAPAIIDPYLYQKLVVE